LKDQVGKIATLVLALHTSHAAAATPFTDPELLLESLTPAAKATLPRNDLPRLTQLPRYELEIQNQKAQADLAYDLQKAITSQQVRAEQLQVEIVERLKAIELMDAEVDRRKRELEAQVLEPANAEARKIEVLADAEKERLAALGAGDADARRLKGLADAEAMTAKAKAWSQYNEAAIADRLFNILPQLAAAVSEPLSRTEKIVMIGGNGSGPGASKISAEVSKVVAELPEMIEALTGVKFEELLKRVPRVAAADADGEAEEER